MNLFVIGNGFDISEGLPTKYADFFEFLKETPDLLDKLKFFYKTIFDEESEKEGIINIDKTCIINEVGKPQYSHDFLWQSLEQNLANVSYEEILRYLGIGRFPIDNIEQQSNNLCKLYKYTIEKLKKSLLLWIDSIDTNTLIKRKFKQSSKFINFNYTDTLEQRFLVSNQDICYVHGAKRERKLIFGCSQQDLLETKVKRYDYINKEYLVRKLDKIVKKHVIKPTEKILSSKIIPFLDKCEIEKIIVLGLSFSTVDLPYLDFIFSRFPNREWIVSYYSQKDLCNIINFFNNKTKKCTLNGDIFKILVDYTNWIK